MAAPEIIELADVMTALGTLREKSDSERSENKAAVVKINDFLDKQEETNQKLTAELTEAKNSQAEVIELKKIMDADKIEAGEQRVRVDMLEKHLARSASPDAKAYKEGDEYKAYNDWCKTGIETEETKALLRTDSNVDGGFLVTSEMADSITKKIVEIDAMRALARVRTIGGKSIMIPIRDSIPVATFEGEADSGDDSTSKYENKTITPYRQTFTAPATQDQLMDSAFDMESEILSDAGVAFAFGEGQGFITGSGNREPEGLITNPILTTLSVNDGEGYIKSGSAATYNADNVIELAGTIKTGYNMSYIFNRREMAFIRTLKSTDGQFLWLPGLNGPVANTINGLSYALSNSMQDKGTDNFPIALGDWFIGYNIVDRTGLSVVRDQFTLKKKAIIEFTFNRWTTGLVVLPEAIRLLKCEA